MAAKPAVIPALDGIRAVAVVLVFLDHAGLPQIVRGATGVTVFFFLSGYLITTLLRLERERTGRISIGGFYARRALRILPTMYLTLAVAVVLTATGVLTASMSVGGVAAVGLFAGNYWIVFASRDGLPAGVNQFWSLAVEEHYYLLFPFVLLALLAGVRSWRRRGQVLAVVCGLVLVWRCVLQFGLHADSDRLYLATDTRLDGILLGAVLAMVANPWLDTRDVAMTTRAYWSRLGGAALLFAAARVMPLEGTLTVGYTLEAVGCWLAFDALIRAPHRVPTRVLGWRPVALLGTLSYGFYLVHRIVISLVEQTPVPGRWAQAAVSFVLTVAVAAVLYVGIERPLARVRARLHRSAGAPVTPPVIPPASEVPASAPPVAPAPTGARPG